MKKPKEMESRLRDGDTDPVFCLEVLNYTQAIERAYKAACSCADTYKLELHHCI